MILDVLQSVLSIPCLLLLRVLCLLRVSLIATSFLRNVLITSVIITITRGSLSSPSSLNLPHTEDLKIGFLPALSGGKTKGQNKYYTGAFIYALEKFNFKVSPHRLVPIIHDNKAERLESIRGMTDQYNNGSVAFIGPEDTCTIEATIAAAWNLPMVAFVSTLSNLVTR